PLGQSKYAIFIRRSRSCRGPGGGGVRDPGQGWLDHAARVRMARGGWAPPGRGPSAGDAAGTGLAAPRPKSWPPPPPGPCRFAASSNFRNEVVDLARLVRGAEAVVDVTTDTPGAHELSIARSAAMPPKDAPYPTL